MTIPCGRTQDRLDRLFVDSDYGKKKPAFFPHFNNELPFVPGPVRCRECSCFIGQHHQGAAAAPAQTAPASCKRTQERLDQLLKECDYGEKGPAFFFPYFKNKLPLGPEPVCCRECSCTIGQHRESYAAALAQTALAETAKPLKAEQLLEQVTALVKERSLKERRKEQGDAVFFASARDYRSGSHAALEREGAAFPYMYGGGHPLLPVLDEVMAIPLKTGVCRPALVNVGARGSGKTVLLLRALEAVPQATTKYDAARIFITFSNATTAVVGPGPGAFEAGLLLRVFHAVLATLGTVEDFDVFVLKVDWTEVTFRGTVLLPQLAEALGVQTLVIAIDEVAAGVTTHTEEASKGQMDTNMERGLSMIFNWADMERPQVDPASQSGARKKQKKGSFAPPVVLPITSCYYPRYAEAAAALGRSGSGRDLKPLEIDLAPCLIDVVEHIQSNKSASDVVDRKAVALLLANVFVKQQYAACGGNFLLCATVLTEAFKMPASGLPISLGQKIADRAQHLVKALISLGNDFATMLAQAGSGMTWVELERRHGDAALPLNPFYQSVMGGSNLPLAVLTHPHVRDHSTLRHSSALTAAFNLWLDAAGDALHQSHEEVFPKLFQALTMHGLALRWAAFLAPSRVVARTSAGGDAAASSSDDWVEFCLGQGSFLNEKGEVQTIDLAKISVLAPCIYMESEKFPSGGAIHVNTYTLATDTNNPGVEGGGCVAASFPIGSSFKKRKKEYRHVYFTVQMKHTFVQTKTRDGHFSRYAKKLRDVVRELPYDAPRIHLYWTPHPYQPSDVAMKQLLGSLRPMCDIVACVNAHDCLTPSLSWTLSCIAPSPPSTEPAAKRSASASPDAAAPAPVAPAKLSAATPPTRSAGTRRPRPRSSDPAAAVAPALAAPVVLKAV